MKLALEVLLPWDKPGDVPGREIRSILERMALSLSDGDMTVGKMVIITDYSDNDIGFAEIIDTGEKA